MMKKSESKKSRTLKGPAGGAKAVRSRAYPAVDLKTAIQLVAQQIKSLGSGAHDREAIAQGLGHAKSSGPAARKIAAMSHFGLLERAGGLYQPTPLARRLLQSNVSNLVAIRREAFLRPTLFRELFETYRTEGQLPQLLGHALAREHGIAASVKEDVAAIFRDSGVFAEVLTPEGSFTGPRPAPIDPTRSASPPEASVVSVARPRESNPQEAEAEDASFYLPLTHGMARIDLPPKLTPADFRKLQTILMALDPALDDVSAPAAPQNVFPIER